MDVKKQIKSFLQQAELYQSQGLLYEAKKNYISAGQLVKKKHELIKNKNLLSVISKKIQVLNEKINLSENESPTVELPENIQDIIKDKFSFSKDDDTAELEGAIALAKFGQFERALKEFDALLEKDIIRVEAAKNIIRCHKALDSIDEAVKRYQRWFSGDIFTPVQLGKLRVFFQSVLDSKGTDVTLPEKKVDDAKPPNGVDPSPDHAHHDGDEHPDVGKGQVQDEDILDISSVGIVLTEGDRTGETVECDVSFQAGSVINLLIASDNQELADTLKTGTMLDNVQFYSPIAMFNGKAVVSSKSKIESGPKQGYYSVDIKVTNI